MAIRFATGTVSETASALVTGQGEWFFDIDRWIYSTEASYVTAYDQYLTNVRVAAANGLTRARGVMTAFANSDTTKQLYPIYDETDTDAIVGYRTDDNVIAWTNPSNAQSVDASYATATIPAYDAPYYGSTKWLICKTPTWLISISAIVVGLRVEVFAKAAGSDVQGWAKLVRGGLIVGDAVRLDNPFVSSDSYRYGPAGIDSLWGQPSMTGEQVSDTNFGVAIAFVREGGTSVAVSLDSVRVSAYYYIPS